MKYKDYLTIKYKYPIRKYRNGDIIESTGIHTNPIIFKVLKINTNGRYIGYSMIGKRDIIEYPDIGTHKCIVLYDQDKRWKENEITYWSEGEYLREKDILLTEEQLKDKLFIYKL